VRQPTTTDAGQGGFFSTGEGATVAGSLVTVCLIVVKMAAGILGNSAALVADALHSVSDLCNDTVVVVGYRWGRRPEDDSHPYGHGKVETLATVVVGGLLVAVGLSLGLRSLSTLMGPRPAGAPGLIALIAAAISVVAKEAIFRRTIRIAKRLDSRLLMANAWDHRSDVFASSAALLGVGAARLGVVWGDAAAAMVVCLFIIRMGWQFGWPSLLDLLDTSLGEELHRQIGATVEGVPGIHGYHDLRTRRLGRDVFVDVDIEVAPELNVIQGHDVARAVKRALLDQVRGVRDAMVHVEPQGARENGVYSEGARADAILAAEQLAQRTTGVLGLHGTRIVPLENGYLLNMDIEVSPDLTIREAHAIAHRLKSAIRELPGIADAVVHVDLHGE
jgi:cation diffusion facilitator family transporter